MDIKEIVLKDPKKGEVTFKYLTYFDKFKEQKPWLKIDKNEWEYITQTFDSDLVKDSLTVLFSQYPFPYREVEASEAIDDFIALKKFDTSTIVKEADWFSKALINDNPALTKTLLFTNNVGSCASDFFFQEQRMNTDIGLSCGSGTTWKSPLFTRTMCNGIYTLKHSEINSSKVRATLALRKGVASQFKPLVAKYIYDNYAGDGNVLDFSAGWGDRLNAFCSSDKTKKYVGLDPNERLHPLYKQFVDFYSEKIDSKQFDFHCSPAEDFDYTSYENMFDLVFTSPPYFNRENYTYDDTQSWVRYRSIESWLENFLFKTVNKVSKTIKKDGHLIINISDVYAVSKGKGKKQFLEICNPLLQYVESMGGFTLEKIIGYKMNKRPNLISVGTATINNGSEMEKFNKDLFFGEPIFIWKKTI